MTITSQLIAEANKMLQLKRNGGKEIGLDGTSIKIDLHMQRRKTVKAQQKVA